MKCTTVRSKLAGYLDDAISGSAPTEQRAQIREHLEACGLCREELERYRKLAVLMSRVPRSVPPADLAVRIRVAAAQAVPEQDFGSHWQKMRDRAEILLDNVIRPLSVPATGGLFSAVLIFVLVLQLMAPGITVQAVANDVPLNTNILRPAEVIALSDYPSSWAPEQHDVELSQPHGLLVYVTVDQNGKMMGYEIISGPNSKDLRHQLDQVLIFSRFRPMMSFGRPTAGGHVILSLSVLRVQG
jgi:anti-sigma factor RsiW